MAKLMRKRQRSAGANRIDKQRLRAVERIDVAGAVGRFRPARRLHRAADFKRQLKIASLPGVVRHAPFVHQPPQVAVGADVVEAVIVDADVRKMRRHHRERALAAELQKSLVARRVELQQCGAILKALRPLGPALRRVAAFHREHRRCRTGRATFLDRLDALGRPRPKPLQLRQKIGRRQFSVEFDHSRGCRMEDTGVREYDSQRDSLLTASSFLHLASSLDPRRAAAGDVHQLVERDLAGVAAGAHRAARRGRRRGSRIPAALRRSGIHR